MLSSTLVLCGQVPRVGPAPARTDVAAVIGDTQGGKRQQAYKTEIIGGVVVHTPIQVIRGRCGYHGDKKSELGLCEKALSSLTSTRRYSMLLNLLLCGRVTYLKPVALRVRFRRVTVMMKPFRMTPRNQKGETGRATGRVC